jgi:hypothetical protein
MYHHPSQQLVAPQLEWRPDIDRLRGEIEEARRTGNGEHLAIAEAECWIDLIDAELTARRKDDDPEVSHLKQWRLELATLLRAGGRGLVQSSVQARRA